MIASNVTCCIASIFTCTIAVLPLIIHNGYRKIHRDIISDILSLGILISE